MGSKVDESSITHISEVQWKEQVFTSLFLLFSHLCLLSYNMNIVEPDVFDAHGKHTRHKATGRLPNVHHFSSCHFIFQQVLLYSFSVCFRPLCEYLCPECKPRLLQFTSSHKPSTFIPCLWRWKHSETRTKHKLCRQCDVLSLASVRTYIKYRFFFFLVL